jgi:hypothetical protein
MSREAVTTNDLLYLAGGSDVAVYEYKSGKVLDQVGLLKGFKSPGGLCTDNKGNVWIPDRGSRRVYEFAHGGTETIGKIYTYGYPYACAVNNANGDVAYSQYFGYFYYTIADVEVYDPTTKSKGSFSGAYGFLDAYFLAYDNKGDLFVDAVPCGYSGGCYYGSSGGPIALYVLPSGGQFFAPVSIAGATIQQPVGLNWINPTLLVADDDYKGKVGVYKLSISGSAATVAASFALPGVSNVLGVTRRSDYIIAPDNVRDKLDTYDLANGRRAQSLAVKQSGLFSAVVSQKASP